MPSALLPPTGAPQSWGRAEGSAEALLGGALTRGDPHRPVRTPGADPTHSRPGPGCRLGPWKQAVPRRAQETAAEPRAAPRGHEAPERPRTPRRRADSGLLPRLSTLHGALGSQPETPTLSLVATAPLSSEPGRSSGPSGLPGPGPRGQAHGDATHLVSPRSSSPGPSTGAPLLGQKDIHRDAQPPAVTAQTLVPCPHCSLHPWRRSRRPRTPVTSSRLSPFKAGGRGPRTRIPSGANSLGRGPLKRSTPVTLALWHQEARTGHLLTGVSGCFFFFTCLSRGWCPPSWSCANHELELVHLGYLRIPKSGWGAPRPPTASLPPQHAATGT